MTNQKQTEVDISKSTKRDRIAGNVIFPRNSLLKSLSVAKTIWEDNSRNPMTLLDLATKLKYFVTSSSFVNLIVASSRYELTTGSWSQDATKTISLSNLGRSIVASTSTDDLNTLQIKALLTPRLFNKVLNNISGKIIPKEDIFKNELIRVHNVKEKDRDSCYTIILKNINELNLYKENNGKKYLVLSSNPKIDSSTNMDNNGIKDDNEAELVVEHDNEIPVVSKPKQIFVAHGKNHKPLDQLKTILNQFKIPFKIAIDESNQGRPISQKVSDLMHEYSSAIFLFTKDEETKDKDGNLIYQPSDNVVFELGAASVLYGDKIVIFKQNGVSFGSDFKDLGYISFEDEQLNAKTIDLMKELVDLGLLKVTPT